jgi:2-succinyl-5-enolpyruvyl-6-hydroxy-3-cyclohexene-1-carboxylate synthase
VTAGLPDGVRSVVLAHVVVDELVRAGVRHVVLSPGSRSAPLAAAVIAAETAGRLRLHVRVDERSAGFTALGIAKASDGIVAVVTTSGTAVANLHPAVLEAHHVRARLLVLTADRPGSVRGTGANQTTDQTRFFGPAAAFMELSSDEGGSRPCAGWRSRTCRALDAARSGPVQLNLGLAEPLVGALPADGVDDPGFRGRPGDAPWTRVDVVPPAVPVVLSAVPARTVVVVGDAAPDVGAAAVALAELGGWPVFAEPSANARAGANAIRLYRLLIGAGRGPAADLTASIEGVVVVGHPTVSRPVARLLARHDIEVVVCGPAPWVDVAGTARSVLPGVPTTVPRPTEEPVAPPRWLAGWQDLDARLAAVLPEPAPNDLDGPAIAAAVVSAATGAEALVVGSSNPVRDLDLAPIPGRSTPTYANRGLAGIDGMVSTAVGVALVAGRTVALVGDLTFLHDANGLLIGPAEARPDLRIVVVNDDGGSIFHTLEQGAPEQAATFERLFGTPHGADLEARSAAVGVPHRRVATGDELVTALAEPIDGIDIVEVAIGRAGRRAAGGILTKLADFDWPTR